MSENLNVGDQAPEFTGTTTNGETINLSDFLGQKVVLYFYPKDNTPGCTKQACNLRDNFSLLTDNNIKVLGASADSETSHQKFTAKHELPFPLLADQDKSIAKKYGTAKTLGVKRITYLIDEAGKIAHIFTKPNTSNHAEEIMEVVSQQAD